MNKPPLLLLTNDKLTRSMALHTLGPEFALETAADPGAALGMLDPRHQIALAEFDMAEMNGLEFLKQVRTGQTKASRGLAVGLLASFADNDFFVAGISLDLNALILRPLSRNEILRRAKRMATDEIKLKPIGDYAAVSVPLSESQIARKEVTERAPVAVRLPATPRPPAAAEPAKARAGAEPGGQKYGPLLRRQVLEVQVGWQVGADVIGPGGVRLIAAGAVLTPRLVTRLRELAEEGAVTEVWARAPSLK